MKKTIITFLLALLLVPAAAQDSPEEKLNMTMYAIMNMYVDSVPKGPFTDELIAKAMKSLDPYSAYLTPEEARANENVLLDGPTAMAHQYMQRGMSTVRQAYMLDKTTGYISVSMFSETTVADFRNALASLKKQGMKSLVIDLQGNPGGFFDAAVDLADEFIDGDKVLVTTQGAHVPTEVRRAKNKGMFEKGRVAVLVNRQTMSAAEVFTAAMSDWNRAVIVGQPTFGKALIQQTMPFKDGSAIRLSVARYLTPKGNIIHGVGVKPQVEAVADTTFQTNWYYMLAMAGVQKSVAAKYAETMGEQLKRRFKTSADYFSRFEDQAQLMNAVRQTAEQAGIPYDEAEYQRSEASVYVQLKALIGRQLYPADTTLYYRILNTRNQPLQRAMEALKK